VAGAVTGAAMGAALGLATGDFWTTIGMLGVVWVVWAKTLKCEATAMQKTGRTKSCFIDSPKKIQIIFLH
jgi:hypothetical protein